MKSDEFFKGNDKKPQRGVRGEKSGGRGEVHAEHRKQAAKMRTGMRSVNQV
jgi:hypothetical protein